MKRFITVLFLLATFMFFSSGTILAESTIPDLTGKWKAKNYTHHHENKGFFSNPEAAGEWVIKEQKGRLFYGERYYIMKHHEHTKVTEGFSGVISRDGKRLYAVDHIKDILIGNILSDGSIELVIINEGDKNEHSRIGLIEIERAK